MPLSTINTQKELALTQKPLLLLDFTWSDGSTQYFATDSLTYNGNAYLPRVLDETLTAFQAFSEQGIDTVPSIDIKLADADKTLYNGIEATVGFKGATVAATFVFWQSGTANVSTDSISNFVGVCQSPSMQEDALVMTATNKLNLTLKSFPTQTIQKLCLYNFPATATDRAANAASDKPCCKYFPDGSGGLALGNYSTGTTPYTSCNYSKSDCQARGMYTSDSSARKTGNFSGIQWQAPASINSRPYGGSFEEVVGSSNPSKYVQKIPAAYGTVWCEAITLNQPNDANYTRMEVLVCAGQVSSISKVVVNGEVIPHAPGTDPVFPTVPPDVSSVADALKMGWWFGVSNGSTLSQPNQESPWSGQGDPYSGMCVLGIVVLPQIASPGSNAQVQVLVGGAAVRVYSSPTAYVNQSTNSPVWNLASILSWLNVDYPGLSLQTWIDAESMRNQSIPFQTIFGMSSTHPRYSMSLFVGSQRGASDLIRGIRNSIKGLLLPDYTNGGKLQLSMLGTLAFQQPNPVDGSNDNTAYPSYNLDGTSGTGYVAYHFSDTNGTIAVDENGNSTFKINQNTMQDAPNSFDVSFWDAENIYSQDSLTLQENDDISLTGMIIPGDYPMDGLNTYDQAQRVGANFFARQLRGNYRLAADGETIGDTKGTLRPQLQTSFKAVKLTAGQIVMVDYFQYGLSGALFRVVKIEPTVNMERITLALEAHNDAHWVDTYGQTGRPLWEAPYAGGKTAITRGWIPAGAPFLTDAADPIFDNSLIGGSVPTGVYDPCMSIGQVSYVTNADGSATASVTVRGYYPMNAPSAAPPPFVPIEGLTSSTGGAFVGGEIVWVSISGSNSNGEGVGSVPIAIYIQPGTNTNTAEVTGLFWPSGIQLGNVYAGMSPDKLYLQQPTSVSGGSYVLSGGTSTQPATITFTNRLDCGLGAPDKLASEVVFRAKKVFWHGIFEALVMSSVVNSGAGTTTINLVMPNTGALLTTNALTGRKLSLLWRNSSQSSDPIYQSLLTIASNTSDTITVNNDTYGLLKFYPGDAITVRAMPTYGSNSNGDYFEDLLYENIFNPDYAVSPGLNITGDLNGKYARIVYGTGAGTSSIILGAPISGSWDALNTATRVYVAPWQVQPDSTSIIIIEDSTWGNPQSTGPFVNNAQGLPLQMQMSFENLVSQGMIIQALVTDKNGVASPESNAPIAECWLATAYGAAIEDGVPPMPLYGLYGVSGFVKMQWAGFDWLFTSPFPTANVSGITSATLTIFYWNESGPDTTYSLVSAMPTSIDVSQYNQVPLNASLNLATVTTDSSTVLLIDNEMVVAGTQDPITNIAQVQRNFWFSTGIYYGEVFFPNASNWSTPMPHAAGTKVYRLNRKEFQIPIRKGYFDTYFTVGSANAYELLEIFSPDTRVYLSYLSCTNDIGTGDVEGRSWLPESTVTNPVTGAPYTDVNEGVIITGTNARRTITMYLNETLYEGTDLADPIAIATLIRPYQVRAGLIYTSTGAPVTADLLCNGTVFCSVSIPATATSQLSNQVTETYPLPSGFLMAAGSTLTLNVTGVGTTYPGLGLMIFIDL